MSESLQKLTLEERLELAAKTRRKGRAKNKQHNGLKSEDSPAITPEPEQLDNTQAQSIADSQPLEKTTDLLEEEVESKDKEIAQTENTSESPTPAPKNEQLKLNSPKGTDSDIELNSEVMKHLGFSPNDLKLPLSDFLARLETQVINNVRSHNVSLSQRDGLIAQLRKEGTALSKKELKLNETIKALKKDKTKSDMKLEICQEELSGKIAESERLHTEFYKMKEKNQKLQEKFDNLKKENELLETKFKNLSDIEMSKTKQELETYKSDSQQMGTKYNSLLAEYEQFKSKSSVQYELLKRTTEEEISILETKLEQYRIRLEDQNLQSDDEKEASKTEYLDKIQSKYNKLASDLQKSNENWSLVEQKLHERLSHMKMDYDKCVSSQKDTKYMLELANEQKETLSAELEKEIALARGLRTQIVDLSSKIEVLEFQLNTAIRDKDMLSDKAALQQKQLEEMLFSSFTVTDRRKGKSSRHNSSLALNKLSSHREEDETEILAEDDASRALKLQLEDEWDIKKIPKEKGLDVVSQDGSVYNMSSSVGAKLEDSRQNSLGLHSVSSFNRHNSDVSQQFLDDSEDPFFGRRVSYVGSTPTQTQSVNPTSTQLVSRMGGQVRRLETELASLRESWEKAQKEKSEAREEMLRLMEENDALQSLKNTNAELTNKVDSLEKELYVYKDDNENKRRTIEELQNDVSDLKELMHIQIQQMVELQEKCR